MSKYIPAILLAFTVLSCAHYSPDKLKSKIVRVRGDHGMCSGEQVKAASGTNYILTAAHCLEAGAKDGSFTIVTEDGKTLKRKIIAEDPKSDLLLLEGLPGVEGLQLGYPLTRGDKVYSLTHGSDMDLYETSGAYIQLANPQIPIHEADEACSKMPKYVVADGQCILITYGSVVTATSVPGSSGGPMFNSRGRLIGVVTGGNSTFSLLVTVDDIRTFLNNY